MSAKIAQSIMVYLHPAPSNVNVLSSYGTFKKTKTLTLVQGY